MAIRAGRGNVYPTVISLAALIGSWAVWLLFMSRVQPACAVLLAQHGASFGPLVRIAVGASQRTGPWLHLVAAIGIGMAAYIGLLWRPEKSLGRNIALTLALWGAFKVQTLLLLTFLDVAPYLFKK